MTFYKYKLDFWVKVLMFWASLSLAVFLFREREVFLIRLDSAFWGFGMLGLVFLITQKILKESSFSFLVIFLLIRDRLFRESLITSTPDLPFGFFICLTFLFLLLAENKIIFFLPAAIFLGLATATKIHLASFGFLGSLSFLVVLVALSKKEKRYLSFFAFIPFFFLAYFGTHDIYFLKGKTIWDFKYLDFLARHFTLVKVPGYPIGEIFKILFLGKRLTWEGGFKRIAVNQWSIFWPLSLTASFLAGFLGWKRKNYPLLLLIVWVFTPLLVYSFNLPYPSYLLPILPPLYIIFVYTLFMREADEEKSPSN